MGYGHEPIDSFQTDGTRERVTVDETTVDETAEPDADLSAGDENAADDATDESDNADAGTDIGGL